MDISNPGNEFFFNYEYTPADFTVEYATVNVSLGRMWHFKDPIYVGCGGNVAWVTGMLKSDSFLPDGSPIADRKFSFMNASFEFLVGWQFGK